MEETLEEIINKLDIIEKKIDQLNNPCNIKMKSSVYKYRMPNQFSGDLIISNKV